VSPDSFIRAIVSFGARLGVEFARKLRFETAACLCELSFSPCSVKQQGVKSFRPQHEESKHKRQYDFRSESHEFTPWLSLCRWLWLCWWVSHPPLSWLT